MQTFKDITSCMILGMGLVSGALVGIFAATLGMCALAMLGAG